MTNAQASRRKEKKKIVASPPPRKARTVRVKRGENPNLAWKKKKAKEEKKGKNAKKKADDLAAVVEAAFAQHDRGVDWTENAELNEHRRAVERLLSVEEKVVEATDLQPDSFFELAFDGE
ncbi:hypothetical protein CB0940_08111 [Cercospora beticola]|uniref:Uncharacterized protein n=1 Tax=Cercospora beticola TaxID=122368 RepID=A0A2G5HR22_CERBT|nr:hypothetical protein CB0940_08111 [Cercospora beticola]PIA94975.1 hypothetical protein CB0940_08111 [Cercospora beticola]WPB04678.1 hypothetical protein RHO25_009324 [Cercospora beticola]